MSYYIFSYLGRNHNAAQRGINGIGNGRFVDKLQDTWLQYIFLKVYLWGPKLTHNLRFSLVRLTLPETYNSNSLLEISGKVGVVMLVSWETREPET